MKRCLQLMYRDGNIALLYESVDSPQFFFSNISTAVVDVVFTL